MMRQAGRFLPSYRKIRSGYTFLEMCANPEVAAKVSMLPVDELGVDAAIIFSDILVVLPPMGFELTLNEGVGPRILNTFDSPDTLKTIKEYSLVDELNHVYSSIEILRSKLPSNLDLIGFAGAPWTLATYLIEGKTGKNFAKTKKLMREHPEAVHQLLTHLSKIVAEHLSYQINAGACVVQLFDSWAGALSPEDFKLFALPYAKLVFDELKNKNKKDFRSIYFPNGASESLHEISELDVDCISVDWKIDISKAKDRVNPKYAIQGNFDPTLLYSDPSTIKEQTTKMLGKMRLENGKFKNYSVNLGHGILPDIPVEGARTFIDVVQRCES
jgi:uroporphyrinogen decarboxylase